MTQRKWIILWLVQGNVGYKSLYCVFINLNI